MSWFSFFNRATPDSISETTTIMSVTDNTSIKTEPILITGGTGFAGSHLVEALLAAGYSNIHVTSYGSSAPKEWGYTVTVHKVDLTNKDQTFELFHQVLPTQIYHLASFAITGNSFDKAAYILQNNSLLQVTILEACKVVTPEAKILIIGSAEEYGSVQLPEPDRIDESYPLRPVNPYAVSKVTQDLLAQAYQLSFKLKIIRVRPFNHIGERQTPHFAIPSFAQQIVAIERGQQNHLSVGNLEVVRDFSDVKDIVQAYILLLEKGQVGEVYNVGSGQGYSIKSLLDQLSSFATVPITVTVDSAKYRPLDVPRIVANNDKIRKLGWEPTIPISETLKRILEYWRHQP